MIDCVEVPVDQVFPAVAEEVSTRLPPAQKVVGPPAEIAGAAGIGLTVTAIGVDVEAGQEPAAAETV